MVLIMQKSSRQAEAFYQRCNQELKTNYLISIEECGLSSSEWLQRYGDLSVTEAVETFCQKYDLSRLNSEFW